MKGPGQRTRRRVMALAAGVGLVLAVFWMRMDSTRAPEPSMGGGSAPEATSSVHIDQSGRRTLDRHALPRTGPVRVVLDLPEEARGDGRGAAIVVSLDGRRMEAETRPAADGEHGVEIAIDASFLIPGRYLIQVDTDEKHPLHFRRYVLELD